MAIKIYEKFAPRANPADANYPYGSIKNESVPGAKDGTPLDAAWGNDYAGFDAALLADAGITPNGLPDTVGNSQRLDAIKAIGDNRYDRIFGCVSDIKLAGDLEPLQIVKTKYYHNGFAISLNPPVECRYLVLTAVDYEKYTGLLMADGIRDHNLQGGLIAMLLPTNGVIGVQQCGAIPYYDTQAAADINRDAFRAAHLSLKADWDARKLATDPVTWTTKVESGDYNLSNGYTVPKGMVSFCDSLGAARIKQLPTTVDANPVLPTVSLGRVINGTATEIATGVYVTNPPPKIHNLYINPQDVRVGVDVTNIPGFTLGDLWIQAASCINLGDGTGDGICGRLFLETGSNQGVIFGDCQNIVIDEIYTFDIQSALVIVGNPNNINIGIAQTNYNHIAALQLNDGASPRNFTIDHLICNQNAQFGTFAGVVRVRSTNADIRIGLLEAYNYNGWAVTNETGLGNVVTIGKAVLKQQRSNDVYTQGTTAKGFNANNCKITVGKLESEGLKSNSIGQVTGAFAASLEIESGYAIGQVDSTNPLVINNTASGSKVRITDFDNKTGFELFNQQSTVEVTYSRVKNPFSFITESTRKAVKVPFNAAGLYELTLRCNTNPSGNNVYRRVGKYLMSVEAFFDGANVVWNAELTEQFKSTQGTGFVPAIDLQLDFSSVGSGTQKVLNSNDSLVFSVPDSYVNLEYQLEPSVS